jgi:putative copper export protein
MKRLGAASLLLLVVIVGWGWMAAPAGAQPPGGTGAHTVPSANEVLKVAPSQLRVIPPDPATAGTVSVMDSAGRQVASGVLAPVGGDVLGVALFPLGTGVFLVSWSAGQDSGAFAFDVAGDRGSPATVVQPAPATPLGPLRDNLVEWVPLISIMIFVGALALRFLVSAPVARRAAEPGVLERTDRWLVRLAAVAIAVFVPTTLADLAFDDGRFDFGSIWPSLGADPAGHLVGARLALTGLAAMCVIPLAFVRAGAAARSRLMAAGLLCGLGELAGREIPSAVPADWPRTIVNTVLYVLHLWGAGIWIGGLAGLLILALGAVPAQARRDFWPSTIRRFSATAMTSVGVLVLSGLWLYWVHVDGVQQLVTTLYGRTLLVKLIVVAVLVLLGAANQFWLMPRIDAQRAAGDHRGLGHTLVRHFRATIAAEVVLGLAVLFIAPLLGGSARNQAFQASPAVLTQTTRVGGATVELTPSALQPGLLDYRIRVDGGPPPRQVTVDFASAKLGVPVQQATAVAVGDNTYRVSGCYTPVVGAWQVGVRLDNAAPAKFGLPIAAKPPKKLPRAPAPQVKWTTWLAGIGWTLLVAGALFSSYRVSRRLTGHRTRSAPPAAEPERDLIDA